MKRAFWMPRTRARLDAELQEEFRFHIEERIEQFMSEGMNRADAEREVERRFGNYEAHRDLTKRIDEEGLDVRRRFELWQTLRRELGLALRALRRSPGFTAIALLTLALGIGATTAIYTVLDAVVLRPLAYHEPERLVSVLHPTTVPGSGDRRWGLSAGGYFQFRDHNTSFSDFAMYRNSGFTVTSGGAAESVQLAVATASIFDVFRARPAFGRLLNAADDVPDGPRVVVLSHEFFQRRFGGDPSIVGKNLETSDGSFTIVGITEPGLVLPMPGPFASATNLAGFGVDVWRPMQANPAGPFQNSHPYVGLGRLKPGATIAGAQGDLDAIFARFPETVPNAYSEKWIATNKFRVEVASLQDAVLGTRVPRVLWMLLGAVSLVLAIAAANVSNLFLVRFETRRRESAIRSALGAGRLQMAVHYLAESLLLCAMAAVFAVGIAAAGLEAMLAIAPTDIPRLAAVTLGGRSIAVATAIALGIGLVLGLAPMFRRTDTGVLREGGRGLSASPRQRVVRNGLVVGQMALALVLLAAAGLMLRSFGMLRDVEPGFDPSNTLVLETSLPYNEYRTREEAIVFHRELQRRLLEIPGVMSAGAISGIPLVDYGTGCSVLWRTNRPYPTGTPTPCVAMGIPLPGAFETLRIPIEGRAPTWDDIDRRTHAAVVTRALADRLWPDESPIGKGFNRNGPTSSNAYEVVGVVEALRAEALDAPPTEIAFLSPTEFTANAPSGNLNDLSWLVRTDGAPGTPDPLALTATVRRIVAEMNPHVPVDDVRTMELVVQASMARVSFMMILLGIAATVALALSAVGLYGVVSYLVAQRRSEIGIRMALGASVGQVVRMVLSQSVLLAVVGVALGLAGALAVNRVLQSMLFEVSPTDPLVLGTVVVLLLGIAVVASLVPAKRAAGIDPAETMRGG